MEQSERRCEAADQATTILLSVTNQGLQNKALAMLLMSASDIRRYQQLLLARIISPSEHKLCKILLPVATTWLSAIKRYKITLSPTMAPTWLSAIKRYRVIPAVITIWLSVIKRCKKTLMLGAIWLLEIRRF